MKTVETDDRARSMGKDTIPRLVMRFALPTIAAMLVNAVYNAVDAVFVSWLGVEQAGAIAVAFPVFMLILGIGLTFGTGASSYIARLLGNDDVTGANEVATTSLTYTALVTVLFTAFALVFRDGILRTAGATDTILPYAREYTTIVIAGSIFPIMSRTLTNIIRAEGSVKFASVVLVLGAALNTALDPLLIFNFGMGIKGAAYATLVSQFITTAVLGAYVFGGRSLLRIRPQYFRNCRPILRKVIKIGLPTFVFQLLMSLSLGLLNTMAALYGDAAVAAMGIASRVSMISMYVVFGFAKGFQPIAGYNYGGGKFKRLKEAIEFTLKSTTAFACVAAVATIALSTPIMSIFSDNQLVQSIGTRALLGLNVMFPFFGLQIVFASLFLAMGNAKQGGLLSIARQGLFFVPMIMLLPSWFGLDGVIFAQAAADLLSTALTVILGLRVYSRIRHDASAEDEQFAAVS